MRKPEPLRRGDKVAVVSLSSGMLGEKSCRHNVTLGTKRLQEFGLEPVFMPNALKGIEYLDKNPQARAEDLKEAFRDNSIKGIICAIGGPEFATLVKTKPKLFTGFSDTTINHLMFYKLGLTTYYGPCFICDLADMGKDMLPYTKEYFQGYFAGQEKKEICPSPVWYEERKDFSAAALGIERTAHEDAKGFEILQGSGRFQGKLLGGCAESIYDVLTGTRYKDEKEICEKYGLFPEKEEWKGKILFIETCEEQPKPELLARELAMLREKGVFEEITGILAGKPQDEVFYEEYKQVYRKAVENPELSIVYNVNFGHAHPRCVLPYGVEAEVFGGENKILFRESMFEEG